MSENSSKLRRLGQTDLWVSGLGFGCAPMMGRVGKSKSLRALATALDGGVNFFDVARSYGYGEAEELLGQFLKGRRDSAVIATKAGIRATPQSWSKKMVRSLAQPLVPLSRGLHRLIRSQSRHEFQRRVFTAVELKTSVETSLRKLGTDHVDILYLHDVVAADLDDGSVLEACRQLVTNGKARYLGLATWKSEADQILQCYCNFFDVVSITSNLNDTLIPETCQSGIGLIGREPFGGHDGLRRMSKQLETSGKSFLNLDPGAMPLHELAGLALGWAVHHSRVDSVIASFFEAAHVKQNLQILAQPDYRFELCKALGRAFSSPSSHVRLP